MYGGLGMSAPSLYRESTDSLMTVQISRSDVVIGFERTDYTVGETDGQVNLVVRVLEGRVSDLVRLRLTTRNGAAFGKEQV